MNTNQEEKTQKQMYILREIPPHPYTLSRFSFEIPDKTCDYINDIFSLIISLCENNNKNFDIIKYNDSKYTVKSKYTMAIDDYCSSECVFKIYLFKYPNNNKICFEMMRRSGNCFAYASAYEYFYNYFNNYFNKDGN